MYRPDEFTRRVLKKHERAVTLLKELEKSRDEIEAEGDWPTWCAMPLSGVYSALMEEGGHKLLLGLTAVKELAPLGAAYIWAQTKQAFEFDSTLYDALTSQPLGGNIPKEALLRLPVPCVYISNQFALDEETVAEGFFAWLEYDVNAKWMELRLLFLLPGTDDSLPFVCPLEGTLEEGLQKLGESAKFRGQAARLKVPSLGKDGADRVKALFGKAMNLLLYLCAEEPDYAAPPRRSRAKPASTGFSKSPAPSKVNMTEVGVRIGATMRQGMIAARRSEGRAEGRTHASPVPHIRRAHWHHFWTGAKASEERKLVLKWIPPVFVGGSDAEATPTLHKVKGEKDGEER